MLSVRGSRQSVRPGWFPDWRGQPCAVIASGPSLTQADVDAVRGFRTIVVNSAWQLAPWADALYAADLRWWLQNGRQLAFDGLRVCPTAEAAVRDRRVQVVTIKWRDRGRMLPLMEMSFAADGTIGHGGNGGFQAINLAVQFGATQIALLGFDMCTLPRGKVHFHGAHPTPMRNPTQRLLAEWAQTLNGQAPALEAHGIRIINATRCSVLTAFRKMNLQEIVAQWGTCPSQAA